MKISKDYTIDSAHSLPHLPPAHKCHRKHGHTYGIGITVKGEIDPVFGWVQDYGDISAAVNPVLARLDHHDLDEILPCKTTAENFAVWLYNELKPNLPLIYSVEIKETATSLVSYAPDA